MRTPSQSSGSSDGHRREDPHTTGHGYGDTLTPGLEHFGRRRSRSCATQNFPLHVDDLKKPLETTHQPLLFLDLASSFRSIWKAYQAGCSFQQLALHEIQTRFASGGIEHRTKGEPGKHVVPNLPDASHNQPMHRDPQIAETATTASAMCNEELHRACATGKALTGVEKIWSAHPLQSDQDVEDAENAGLPESAVPSAQRNFPRSGEISGDEVPVTNLTSEIDISESNALDVCLQLPSARSNQVSMSRDSSSCFTISERIKAWLSNQTQRRKIQTTTRLNSSLPNLVSLPSENPSQHSGHGQSSSGEPDLFTEANTNSWTQGYGNRQIKRQRHNSDAQRQGPFLNRNPGHRPGRLDRCTNKRKEKFPCVYHNAGDQTSDCASRKQFVSQLRRHHDRHGFFYCTSCFLLFPHAENRDNHTRANECAAICVTEDCENRDHRLMECNHRQGNSQRDIWRQLSSMARPGEDIPDPNLEAQSYIDPGSNDPQQALPQTGASWAPSDQELHGTLGPHPSAGPGLETSSIATPPEAAPSEYAGDLMQLTVDLRRRTTDLSEMLQAHPNAIDARSHQTIQDLRDHIRINLRQLQRLIEHIRSTSKSGSRYPAIGASALQRASSLRPPLRQAFSSISRLGYQDPGPSYQPFHESLAQAYMADSSPNTGYSGPSDANPNTSPNPPPGPTDYGMEPPVQPNNQSFTNVNFAAGDIDPSSISLFTPSNYGNSFPGVGRNSNEPQNYGSCQ